MARKIDQDLQAIREAVYGEEVRGAIVDGIEQAYLDANDVVKVSETQPTAENVKLWVKPESEEFKVPTWEEHQELVDALGGLHETTSDDYVTTNLFDPFLIKTGKYYNRLGNLDPDPSGVKSIYYDELIPTNGELTLYYYRADEPLNTLSICTYDANKNFIERRNTTAQYGTLNLTGVSYIKWSLYNGANYKSTVQLSTTLIENGKAIRYLTDNTFLAEKQLEQIDGRIKDEITEVVDGIIHPTNVFSEDQLIVGGYYNGSGSIVSQPDSFYIEDYIPTTENKTFYYTYTAVGEGDTISILRYPADKSSVSRINLSSLSGSFTVDGTVAFIRFSVYGGAANKSTLQISPYPLVDGKSANVLSDGVMLSSPQLDQVSDYIADKKSLLLQRHGSVGAQRSGYYVFIPTFYGYACYDLQYYTSSDKNADVWRINCVMSYDDKMVKRFEATIAGELECAIKLHERTDYAGGMMHGSERYTNVLFNLDGKYYTIAELASYIGNGQIIKFDHFKMLETSTMYDPSDETTEFAIHTREYVFTNDGVKIRQSVKWLLDEQVDDCYLAMITPAKVYTTDFYTDTDFTPKNCLQNYGDYPKTKKVTYFSSESGLTCSCKILDYPSGYTGSDNFNLRDNGSHYNKGYFYVCSSATISAGTIWKAESKYQFDFVATD